MSADIDIELDYVFTVVIRFDRHHKLILKKSIIDRPLN